MHGNNPFKGPGDDDLNRMKGKSDPAAAKPSNSPLVNNKGGGGGKAARETVEARKAKGEPEPAGEPLDMSGGVTPEEKKKAVAKLSEPAWVEEETFFLEEADVRVKLTLPEDKKHMTRVEAELSAIGVDGPPISKGEGHADENGIVIITLPVYKPQGYLSGKVDYYMVFKHKLADPLDTKNKPRTVTKTRLKAADHALVPGVSFSKNSSFIGPKDSQGLKKLEQRLQVWERRRPKKTKVVVYGHADIDETDSKALSERRAQSARAFIANDVDTWENIYTLEKWGLIALQEILKDLKHYGGNLTGVDDAATQKAFKAFQKKAHLPETGKEDSATRKALFEAYMKGKHDIKIEADAFRLVAGNSWMGCAAHNRVKAGDAPAPMNRRVAFVLLRESKFFPPNFPCKDGSETPCQGQCKKKGERSKPGIGCLFYDELIQEETQEYSEAEPQKEAEPITYEEAQKIAFEVTGNYETIGCDYSAVAGNFDGAGLSFGAMQWNIGTGTFQKLLKAFETEDKTIFEKCFEDNADVLKRIREVMEEKQATNGHPFPDGMKWATEEAHEWDGKATWKGDWKKHLANLGAEEKFRAVELREGIAHNKGGTEAKLAWLRGKNPSAWLKVPLRCYCAIFDLTNQIGRAGGELSEVEKAWSDKMPSNALEMTQDFIRLVIENRSMGKNAKYRQDFLERRQGILYAGYYNSDVTPGYAEPNRKMNVEDLVGKDKFIQDYPDG